MLMDDQFDLEVVDIRAMPDEELDDVVGGTGTLSLCVTC
ncbi:hypothetical protein EV192_10262 [Actinocrispum wychmicini]|uniref:Uncharacterized protein n=1 Tax=Actinocrispum wychmicini TaxID=1213861 RepID=A0A4R2K6H0_9PSEU|nr:hypothetical protein EV192_10262 [Actinocrispum wychmicini]